MRKMVCFLVLFSIVFILLADVENPDKPIKGVWDFQLEEIWHIEKAGDDVFSPLHNSAIKGNYLYTVLTDKQDYVIVSKYRIKLPTDS